ncbi:Light-inducible protein CPRF2, partial [Linum perenne]
EKNSLRTKAIKHKENLKKPFADTERERIEKSVRNKKKKEGKKKVCPNEMHNVFSADDFTDPFWQAPPDASINRNASEWDLERFLREFPSSGSNSASDSTVTVSVPSQSPPSTKPENCDGDVIEIRKPHPPQLRNHVHNNHAPSMPHSQPRHVPQPLDRAPMATIDTEEYRAFLKSQLDLACAAVARNQATVVKPPDYSPLPENRSPSPAANSFHLGSHLPFLGLGNSIALRQDHGSPGIQPLPAAQKKQEVQTRQTTGASSGEDSDDDDLEGDTGTNGAPADVKRSRRMLSNRESARRSRRRKQEQLNELESQAGQLRDERTTLLSRLTDVNHKCDEASVDNRVLKANIETLRAKVKMAEEQVKRVTGLNPLLLARSNVPNMGMHQYTGGHTGTANHHPFHHPPPNIAPSVPPPHMQPMHNTYTSNNNNNVVAPIPVGSHSVNGMNHNIGGMNSIPFRANDHRVPDVPSVAPPPQMQKPIGPGVNPRPVDASGLSIHGVATKVDKKK